MWAAWKEKQEQEQLQQRPREQGGTQQRRQQDWQSRPRGVDDGDGAQDSRLVRGRGSPAFKAHQHHSRKRGRTRSRSRDRGTVAHHSRSRSRSRSRSPPASKQRHSGSSRSPLRSRHKHRSRSSSHSRSRRAAAGGSSPAADDIADAGAAAGRVCNGAAGRKPHEPGVSLQRSPGHWSDEGEDAAADQELLQWLADSKSVRGRGSIGPRADVPGPYLPVPQGSAEQQLQGATVRGPEKPVWLQGHSDGRERARPNTAFLRGVLATQGLASGSGRAAAKGRGDARDTSSSSSSGSESGSDSSSSRRRRKRRKSKDKRRDGSSGSKHKKSKKKSKEKSSKKRSKR